MKKIIKILAVFLLISLVAEVNAIASFNFEKIDFASDENKLKPFGENLFTGQFGADKTGGLNSNYLIQAGDEITIAIWGLFEFKETLKVDNQGNIFIPQIGPVKVSGVANSQLNNKVKSEVRKIYPSEVEIYTTLNGTKPLSVFVTGGINRPGRYAGMAKDTILNFIDQAQGINFETGSFRTIKILRDKKLVESFDIYQFLINGQIPNIQLKDNDVILIDKKGATISADGEVGNKNIFEFKSTPIFGNEIINFSKPTNKATNVSVSGFRAGKPFAKYLTLEEFKKFQLQNGDAVLFNTATIADKIKVFVEGEHLGPDVVVAPNDSTIMEVLSQVKINPELANYKSVRLERLEVASRQKSSLENSLKRLEEAVLVNYTTDKQEAQIKQQELTMVQNFIKNAKQIRPKGTVVIAKDGKIEDIKVRDGDRIIIPSKSNIVMVTGEVNVPSAVVFNADYDIDDYIDRAGGYSLRAKKDNIIIVKQNGDTLTADSSRIEAGDEIIILPEIKMDNLTLAKTVMELIYRTVLSVAVPINLLDN
ncbi:MAG: polysaccharide biosynthesis/export family protein [Rickettsiales bacterium]|nr:polysaccharide biosynthesis/export family protein [Rickettsiales bacterium]